MLAHVLIESSEMSSGTPKRVTTAVNPSPMERVGVLIASTAPNVFVAGTLAEKWIEHSFTTTSHAVIIQETNEVADNKAMDATGSIDRV